MKRIFFISLMVAVLTNLGFGQETSTGFISETTQEVQIEEYVPKVILEGKWGTGEGEFGIDGAYLEEGQIVPKGQAEPVYPTSLAVDSNGNIYILDTVNNCIQKFNSKGKYVFSIPVESWQGYLLGKPKGVRGINIVIDSQDNLYYYLIKGEKGEVWQFKEDKLVKKWEVERGNSIRLLNDLVFVATGEEYVEIRSKEKHKNLRKFPRKKGDLEISVQDPTSKLPDKFLICREKNKTFKINIPDSEYPINEMDILPSGEIYVQIAKGKGKEFRRISYLFDKDTGKKKRILYLPDEETKENYKKAGIDINKYTEIGIEYDGYQNKMRSHFLFTSDKGIKVIKYVPENK